MEINIIKVGDTDVEYYLNNGWEIIATAPNPYPQPYIFFFIKKELDKKLSKIEKQEMEELAHNYD